MHNGAMHNARYTTDVPAVVRRAEHLLFAVLVVVAVVALAASGPTGRTMVAAVVLTAALVAWYVAGSVIGHRLRQRAAPVGWLSVLVVSWSGTVVISEKYVWLAFPLFLLIWQMLQFRSALPFAVVVLAVTVIGFAAHTHAVTPAAILGPSIGAVVTGAGTVIYRRLRQETEERRRLIDELIGTREALARSENDAGRMAERERMARELHDTVGQNLTSVGLLIKAALDPNTDDVARDGYLETALTASEAGLADTRRVVSELSDQTSSAHTLADALHAVTADSAPLGLPSTLTVTGTPVPISTRAEVAMVRAVQEALANARKHARASRCDVTLDYRPDRIVVTVVDDGRCFDTKTVPAQPLRADGTGFGLKSMATRLAEIGGAARVDSKAGSGTTVRAEIGL